MALVSTQRWEVLERRRSTLFLVAGLLFAVNVAVVSTGIATGSERTITLLGETFNAAAWAVALLGVLGLYPGVADRSHWLARAGAVCAAIGVVVFTALSGLSFVYYAEIVRGDIADLVPLILPGVIVGGVLSYLLFGLASLRTDAYSRGVGYLLLLPPLIVVANIGSGAAGFDSSYVLLAVVGGLLLVALALGLRLRSAAEPVDRAETAQGRAVD